MSSTEEERIKDLQENGPAACFADGCMIITLLRDGKAREMHSPFYRDSVHIVSPETRPYYPIIETTADYFIHLPGKEGEWLENNIPITKEEAQKLETMISQIYESECADEEYGDEDDDGRASVTSVELRVNARIVADEAAAKMNNEIEQEKQAVQNEWSDARKQILARHEALLAVGATKQLNERMRQQASETEQEKQAFQNEWAAGRQHILARHEALCASHENQPV
jgi:hypothetical protein